MDEKEFKERVSRLKEVSKIIETLPVEIRALSFPLLEDYISGESYSPNEKGGSKTKPKSSKAKSGEDNNQSRDEFLAAHDHDKPSDNVYLLIASHYREYGSQPFSLKEISELGAHTGVTIPNRIDMTIKTATSNGKNLFVVASRGLYKPTVHGEAFLKEKYGVTKGTKIKEDTE